MSTVWSSWCFLSHGCQSIDRGTLIETMIVRMAGLGERGMELMAARAASRVAFGKAVSQQGAFVKELAQHRIQLDAARSDPPRIFPRRVRTAIFLVLDQLLLLKSWCSTGSGWMPQVGSTSMKSIGSGQIRAGILFGFRSNASC